VEPLSEYRIQDNLRQEGLKAPLQVYPALDRLLDMGLVDRVESLNALLICTLACVWQDYRYFPAFQICDACGHVEGFHDNQVERELLCHSLKAEFRTRKKRDRVKGNMSELPVTAELPQHFFEMLSHRNHTFGYPLPPLDV